MSYILLVFTCLVYFSCEASRYPNREVTEKELDFVTYLRLYNYLRQPIDIQGIDDIDVKNLFTAVFNFQIMARVEGSGTMNNNTYQVMHLPRCGSLDIKSPSQLLHNNRSKRFYTSGRRLPDRSITWKLKNTVPSMTQQDTRRLLTEAFRVWATSEHLHIYETSDDRADIKISFSHIDGPGMRLGDSYVPLPKAEVLFDESENWTSNTWAKRGEFNFYQYAVHQIGHVMGLEHSSEDNSVMQPIYKQRSNFRIGYDDILAMHELYNQ